MAKQELTAANLVVEKPQIGAPILTVGDIALALKPLSPDIPGNRERIIHWGRAGVLQAIGREHGGPGRHRLYDGDAKFDAALLHVVTSVGLPVNRSKFLPEVMAFARAQLVKWKKSPAEPLPTLIVSATAEGNVSVGDAAGADSAMVITIDLAGLWAKVA